ncbi:DUF302 domain-containing protein [Roseibium album]|uniref:DUF302 domain-containing protein n=1 Tax=Roseibium album TaxID=311410 RepID=UPI0024931110|nr:DUF302 domain-containing protein [Roseibium album]
MKDLKPLIQHFLRSLFAAAFVFTGVSQAYASSTQAAVDKNFAAVERAVNDAGLITIVSIDHARLAAEEGVEMPPSRVQIFSDPGINTAILSENVRAGLDLPFRVLSYAQDGTVKDIYTDAEFLKIRHGLNNQKTLDSYRARLNAVVRGVSAIAAPTQELTADFGIIELNSSLSVGEAVSNLTEIVMAQDDTVWFGEINFTNEASKHDVTLPEAVLLLFGGPAPGGVAMADFPSIGLDAFCQKLLVYADENGGSVVIFNDIAALAELHYGSSAKPHQALNEQLTATFKKALEQ